MFLVLNKFMFLHNTLVFFITVNNTEGTLVHNIILYLFPVNTMNIFITTYMYTPG